MNEIFSVLKKIKECCLNDLIYVYKLIIHPFWDKYFLIYARIYEQFYHKYTFRHVFLWRMSIILLFYYFPIGQIGQMLGYGYSYKYIYDIFGVREVVECDAPESWQFGPQDPATPIMEGMIFFHNYLMFFIIVIGVVVLFVLTKSCILFNEKTNIVAQNFTHASILEIIWTIIPAITLLIISIPSFALLYSIDEVIDPAMTLKVIGHQWYWTYEYSDYATLKGGENISFDSYMIPSNDLTFGSLRLLEVDNRVVLPVNTHIRVLVTSADVLHSWAVPSLGIKVDAVPGRLSQASLFVKRQGVFYGQCSEICGVNHAFMPIVVRSVSLERYINWIGAKLTNLELPQI